MVNKTAIVAALDRVRDDLVVGGRVGREDFICDCASFDRTEYHREPSPDSLVDSMIGDLVDGDKGDERWRSGAIRERAGHDLHVFVDHHKAIRRGVPGRRGAPRIGAGLPRTESPQSHLQNALWAVDGVSANKKSPWFQRNLRAKQIRGYSWGTWTRTKNKRIRISRVANYTIPHRPKPKPGPTVYFSP
jgi:hypothetical protein